MPRPDGSPTIAEIIGRDEDQEDYDPNPRRGKPWPPEEDCQGCPGHRDGPHKFSCNVHGKNASQLVVPAEMVREGAGLPHAWFCYLWHNYRPGSHEQEESVKLASCARCGNVMPRDPARWDLPCRGKVKVELRGPLAR